MNAPNLRNVPLFSTGPDGLSGCGVVDREKEEQRTNRSLDDLPQRAENVIDIDKGSSARSKDSTVISYFKKIIKLLGGRDDGVKQAQQEAVQICSDITRLARGINGVDSNRR